MCIHLLTALLNSLPDRSVAGKSNFITFGNKSANGGTTISHWEICFECDKLRLNGCNAAATSSYSLLITVRFFFSIFA